MEKQLLKKSGIIAAIVTCTLLGAWFGFSNLSLGIDSSTWTKYALKKDSVIEERVVIQCGTSGATIVFGTTTGAWVGTPTDSSLAKIGLNTGTGKLEIKNAGTDTSSPIVKYHADLSNITPNQHHNQVHGTADHSGNIGAESQITFGTQSGHAHTGTDSTKINYSNLNNRSHGAADHSGNIGAESQITFGTQSGHAHTGTDSASISHDRILGTGTTSHPNLDAFKNSKAQASGLASLEANSLVVQNPASASKTPGTSTIVMTGTNTDRIADAYLSDNITKLGTPTTDSINEGSTNKYYNDARVNAAVGSLSVNTAIDVNIIFNENDFIKIVGGQLVSGSSTASVAFTEVTGSATASQLPLISGLLGSTTSAQSPPVLRLSGTTTEQAAGAFGQLYVQSSLVEGNNNFGTLTTASLVSYYQLENLTDSFGSNNLTNYGTTTFVVGKYGNCATFNGTTQYLQTNVLSTATTNISMFGWVYIASASEARPFFSNGHFAGDQGYALGVGNTSFSSGDNGNNLIGQAGGVAWMNFGTGIGTGWHHVGITRDATTWRGYIDKVQCVTTFTTNPTVPATYFTIGAGQASGTIYFNNKIDDVVFYNKCLSAGEVIELYNNTWTDGYTQYSAIYKDPVNGQKMLEVLTPGTATTKASYIYLVATTTVFGLGTNTAITATATAYSGWFPDAVRATAFNVASVDEIKSSVKRFRGKDKLLQMNAKSWHPKIRDIYWLDAEAAAKEEYVRKDYASWEVANRSRYISNVEMPGTGTAQILNSEQMLQDFKTEKELAWASDLTQTSLVEEMQDTLESDAMITRLGFLVRDPSTPKEVIEGETINLMSVATLAVEAIQSQQDEIGSLTTALENQKIAYNEEVDNLYKLINAIIVALAAVGGVSGWATIRRKRKGT